MKKTKKKIISNAAQKVAVDILERIIFCKDIKEVSDAVHRIEKEYQLCTDPFTCLPCTRKEYAESSAEYTRQLMVEKYGYYEE